MSMRWRGLACAVAVLLATAAAGGAAAERPVAGVDDGGGWFAARWERVERPEARAVAAAEQADDKKAKKNEETVLALYQAFAAGDLDTILVIIHPDVVWIESDGIPYGGTFVGRDAVFAGVFGKIAEEWDGFTAEIELMFAAEADRVVVLGQDSGTFKATGKSMVAPAASIWTLNKDGQVVRFVQYIDTRAVHEATIP